MLYHKLWILIIFVFLFLIYLSILFEEKTNLLRKFLKFLFNRKEELIIHTAFQENKSNQKYWVINNIITPLIILYLPYVFTMISNDFQVISFGKTLEQLTLTGALTMIGINLMRTNLTSVNEELKNDGLKDEPLFKELFSDNESLKSKLRTWVHILTILGTMLYFMQVGGFIIADLPQSLLYIFITYIVFVLSALFARMLSVIQSNFAKNDDRIRTLFKVYKLEEDNEYNSLKNEAENGGLL